MSNEKQQPTAVVQIAPNMPPMAIDEEAIKVLSDAGIIPAGTPPAQVAVFAEVARRHNLDPFTKQLHLVGYPSRNKKTNQWETKYTTIIGIDGFRSRACSSGVHAGTDDALYDLQPDGKYLTAAQLKKANRLPETCTKTVRKIVGGHIVTFTKTVVFDEYNSGKSKWASGPFMMIDKVAEAHALRMGFPNETAGLSIEEEMAATADDLAVPVDEARAPSGVRPAGSKPSAPKSNDNGIFEEATVETLERDIAKQDDEDEDYLDAWRVGLRDILEAEDVAAVQRLGQIEDYYRRNKSNVADDEAIIELFREAKAAIGELEPEDVEQIALWK